MSEGVGESGKAALRLDFDRQFIEIPPRGRQGRLACLSPVDRLFRTV
jgi:hypothetical protein